MSDLARAWRRVPWSWKKYVALAAAGWTVERLSGTEGVLLLLVVLFFAGAALEVVRPRRGGKLSGFAVDEAGGQVADLVTLPLLAPIALRWWTYARDYPEGPLAGAIGYTALFVVARLFLPYAVRTAFEPRAWSAGKRRRRRARRGR
jgi:hypothetical protein